MQNVAAGQNPFGVDFCVTGRCNLACSYCSTRYAKGRGRRLSAALMKRALDTLSADPVIRRRYGGRVDVEFTGGEPLLEFAAVREAIAHIRARKMAFDVAVSTNGTLLTPDKMAFLAASGARVYVSVDGRRRANDLHRKFRNTGNRSQNRSVFDAVMENLARLAGRREYRERLCVSTTFTRRTLGGMPGAIEFFNRQFGVTTEIGLDIYGDWNQAGRTALRRVLRKIRRQSLLGDFPAALRPGEDVLGVPCVWQRDAVYNELATSAVALFPDGRFYPCDFSFIMPLGAEYRVGSAAGGLDFGRFDALCAEPEFLDVSRKGLRYLSALPPLIRYRWGKFRGFSAAELNRLMADTAAVNAIFDEELGQYIKLRMLRRRLLERPGFEDSRWGQAADRQ